MVEGEVEVDTSLCKSVDGAPWAIPDNQSCVVRVPYMAGLTKYLYARTVCTTTTQVRLELFRQYLVVNFLLFSIRIFFLIARVRIVRRAWVQLKTNGAYSVPRKHDSEPQRRFGSQWKAYPSFP